MNILERLAILYVATIFITLKKGWTSAAGLTGVDIMPVKAYSASKNDIDREFYKYFTFAK